MREDSTNNVLKNQAAKVIQDFEEDTKLINKYGYVNAITTIIVLSGVLAVLTIDYLGIHTYMITKTLPSFLTSIVLGFINSVAIGFVCMSKYTKASFFGFSTQLRYIHKAKKTKTPLHEHTRLYDTWLVSDNFEVVCDNCKVVLLDELEMTGKYYVHFKDLRTGYFEISKKQFKQLHLLSNSSISDSEIKAPVFALDLVEAKIKEGLEWSGIYEELKELNGFLGL